MKDASKQRRSAGKLGILTAAAIILPLTATIVPAVGAHDVPAAPIVDANPVIKKKVKIIRIDRDGKTVNVIGHDGDGKEVTRVERDGNIFVFRTDKKLSQAEVETMIESAQVSREAADEAWVEASEARGEAEAARGEAEAAWGDAQAARANAAAARGHAEAMRVHAVAMAASLPKVNVVRLVPRKIGFPMTEETYRSIRSATAPSASERDLLEWTLSSLTAARENYVQKQGKIDKRDREILNALDREIGHLKTKIDRI